MRRELYRGFASRADYDDHDYQAGREEMAGAEFDRAREKAEAEAIERRREERRRKAAA